MLLQEESVGSAQNMARQLVNAQEIELCQFIDQHFWILIFQQQITFHSSLSYSIGLSKGTSLYNRGSYYH